MCLRSATAAATATAHARQTRHASGQGITLCVSIVLPWLGPASPLVESTKGVLPTLSCDIRVRLPAWQLLLSMRGGIDEHKKGGPAAPFGELQDNSSKGERKKKSYLTEHAFSVPMCSEKMKLFQLPLKLKCIIFVSPLILNKNFILLNKY